MDNIMFSYLYRDAGNYKKWGEVVFSNPEALPLAAIAQALGARFLVDGLFIARQIRIPEVFLFDAEGVTDDDHCYHEFDAVLATSKVPSDWSRRTISEFIDEVTKEANRGWRPFDPNEVFPC